MEGTVIDGILPSFVGPQRQRRQPRTRFRQSVDYAMNEVVLVSRHTSLPPRYGEYVVFRLLGGRAGLGHGCARVPIEVCDEIRVRFGSHLRADKVDSVLRVKGNSGAKCHRDPAVDNMPSMNHEGVVLL